MTLYLDTSSLVKLYVQEEGSEAVQALASQTAVITTSWLAYTEARAAFASKYREGVLTDDEYQPVVAAFEQDWPKYLRLEVSYPILLEAGQLAERLGLRASDAIHLASAIYIAGLPPSWANLTLSSADEQLLAAAQAEGLATQLG